MKKATSISILLLVLLCGAACVNNAQAQRGYRGSYSRGYRGGYASNYGGNLRFNYGGVYRTYPTFSYRPPVIVRPRYISPVGFGPRYYAVPHGSITINFGGNPYYYYGGSFYRPFGSYFQMILPPVGIRIGMLPPGYVPLYVGPDEYYFYNGTYYRRYDERTYEVVNAPMGAQVNSLPRGAKRVMVNGEKFYELNGTYYKEGVDSKGRVVYTVVGKHGEIQNTEEAPAPPDEQGGM